VPSFFPTLGGLVAHRQARTSRLPSMLRDPEPEEIDPLAEIDALIGTPRPSATAPRPPPAIRTPRIAPIAPPVVAAQAPPATLIDPLADIDALLAPPTPAVAPAAPRFTTVGSGSSSTAPVRPPYPRTHDVNPPFDEPAAPVSAPVAPSPRPIAKPPTTLGSLAERTEAIPSFLREFKSPAQRADPYADPFNAVGPGGVLGKYGYQSRSPEASSPPPPPPPAGPRAPFEDLRNLPRAVGTYIGTKIRDAYTRFANEPNKLQYLVETLHGPPDEPAAQTAPTRAPQPAPGSLHGLLAGITRAGTPTPPAEPEAEPRPAPGALQSFFATAAKMAAPPKAKEKTPEPLVSPGTLYRIASGDIFRQVVFAGVNAAQQAGGALDTAGKLHEVVARAVIEAVPPDVSTSVREEFTNAAIVAANAAIAIPETGVGLADIATGGDAGKLAEDYLKFRPGEAKKFLATYYSPAQQAAFAEVQKATGVIDTTIAMLANPSTILINVAQSLPSMALGSLFGRGVAGAGTASRVLSGAVGEGIVSAGSAAEQIRQQSPDGRLTPEQAQLATLSGVGTTVLGRFGNKIAEQLGVADVDTMLIAAAGNAAARQGLVTRVVYGATSEMLEELPQSVQEQILQNKATGRPWTEGVDHAAVMGALAGAVMGAGANVPGPLRADQPAASRPAQSFPRAEESFTTPEPDVTGAGAPPPGSSPASAGAPPSAGTPPAPETSAGVPVLIPKIMQADLRARGYTQADIDQMTPEQTHAISAAKLNKGEVDPLAEIDATLAPPTAEAEAKPETHDYSSTQVNLPPADADAVRELGASIPDDALAGDGRETTPHITVKYGLTTSDAEDVRKVLAGEGPITVTLGKTSTFKPSEGSDGAAVLKVSVDSPGLHRLNQKIADALEHEDSFPDYQPHVTVAYVKPERAREFAGNAALKGRTITLSEITFAGKDGTTVTIPLGATPAAAEQPAPPAEPSAPVTPLTSLGKPFKELTKQERASLPAAERAALILAQLEAEEKAPPPASRPAVSQPAKGQDPVVVEADGAALPDSDAVDFNELTAKGAATAPRLPGVLNPDETTEEYLRRASDAELAHMGAWKGGHSEFNKALKAEIQRRAAMPAAPEDRSKRDPAKYHAPQRDVAYADMTERELRELLDEGMGDEPSLAAAEIKRRQAGDVDQREQQIADFEAGKVDQGPLPTEPTPPHVRKAMEDAKEEYARTLLTAIERAAAAGNQAEVARLQETLRDVESGDLARRQGVRDDAEVIADVMGAVPATSDRPKAPESRPSGKSKPAATYWMNVAEIEQAVDRFKTDPVLGPAARFLQAFQEEVDRISDGWPYWSAPSRAAGKLMALLHGHLSAGMGAYPNLPVATSADVQATLAPIKAFITREARWTAKGIALPTAEKTPKPPASKPAVSQPVKAKKTTTPAVAEPVTPATTLKSGTAGWTTTKPGDTRGINLGFKMPGSKARPGEIGAVPTERGWLGSITAPDLTHFYTERAYPLSDEASAAAADLAWREGWPIQGNYRQLDPVKDQEEWQKRINEIVADGVPAAELSDTDLAKRAEKAVGPSRMAAREEIRRRADAPAKEKTSTTPAAPEAGLYAYSVGRLQQAFNLTEDQAAAADALVQAMGLDTDAIQIAKGGTPGDGALHQEIPTHAELLDLRARVLATPSHAVTVEPWMSGDRNAVRTEAIARHVADGRTRVTNRETGHVVRVARSGIRSALQHGIGPEKVAVLRALNDLITDATFVARDTTHLPPGATAVETYAGRVSVDGRPFIVRLVIKEVQDGRRFYDHELSGVEREHARPASTSGADASAMFVSPASSATQPLASLGKRVLDAALAVKPGGPDVLYQAAEPFYSRLARTVEESKNGRATGAQWKATIRNSKLGTNQDEYTFAHVEDLEDAKVYSKADVLAYLQANEVRVEPVVLGEGDDVAEEKRLTALINQAGYDVEGDPGDTDGDLYLMDRETGDIIDPDEDARVPRRREIREAAIEQLREEGRPVPPEWIGLGSEDEFKRVPPDVWEALAKLNAINGAMKGTHFSSYQLAGGDEGSYREVLLTVPPKPSTFDPAKVEIKRHLLSATQGSTSIWYDGIKIIQYSDDPKLQHGGAYEQRPDEWWMSMARSLYEKGDQVNRVASKSGNWVDGHGEYDAHKNPIVRVRFNVRSDHGTLVSKLVDEPDGGLSIDMGPRRVMFLEEVQPPQKAQQEKMPALFLKHWREIAFKWALRYAAENGLDAVAWTTGAQQAERYSLEKEVQWIRWGNFKPDLRPFTGATRFVYIKPKSGSGNQIQFHLDDTGLVKSDGSAQADRWAGAHITDIVGKEIGDRILANDGIRPNRAKKWEGAVIKSRPTNIRGDAAGRLEYWMEAPDGTRLTGMEDSEESARSTAKYHQQADAKEDAGGSFTYEIAGEGLKVGGHGLKKLYDQDFPAVVNKIPAVKKAGVKVATTTLTTRAKPNLDGHGWQQATHAQALAALANERDAVGYDTDNGTRTIEHILQMKGWDADELHRMAPRQLLELLENDNDLDFDDIHLRVWHSAGDDAQPSIAITPELRQAVLGGQPLFQGAKGAVEFSVDGKAIIRGLAAADFSTGIHEIAHVARRQLLNHNVAPSVRHGITTEHILAAEEWAGATGGVWTVAAEEKFARGLERYLHDGVAPDSRLAELFGKIRAWLRDIYQTFSGSDIDVTISPKMRQVFDRLVSRGGEQAPQATAKPKPTIDRDAKIPVTDKPRGQSLDWTEIGKNAIGQTLYQDQRGVRSYIENGVRITEPIQLEPTRGGMLYSVDRSGDRAQQWKEVGAPGTVPATPAHTWKVGDRATSYQGTGEIIQIEERSKDGGEDAVRLTLDDTKTHSKWINVSSLTPVAAPPASKPAKSLPTAALTGAPQLALRIGGRTDVIAVQSLEGAARLVEQLRDHLEEIGEGGNSRFPGATVIDTRMGNAVATISYNGRIWDANEPTRELVERPDGRGYGKDRPIDAASAPASKPAAEKPSTLVPPKSLTADGVEFVVQPLVKTDAAKAADAKRAELEAKAAAIIAKLKTNLKNTASMGGITQENLLLVAELTGVYVEMGILEFGVAVRRFQEDFGKGARALDRAFEIAWAQLTDESYTVADVLGPAYDDQDADGRTPADSRGDGAGQLPERGGPAADAPGVGGEGPLGAVLPELGGEPAGAGTGRPGDGRPGGVVADGVSDPAATGEGPRAAPDAGGGPVPGGALAPTGVTGSDPGHAPADYQLTPERIAAIIDRGPVTRAKDNLAAIRLVRTLQTEKRHATPAEQDALAKYVGWGATEMAAYLAEFPDYKWSANERAIWQELQDIYSDDERAALVGSTVNAHFTFDLYRPIWEALARFGFTGGRVLEPAVGSGHAFGFMPVEIRAASTLNASELEPLTAAIAQALYPSARVQPVGYEQARITKGSQDLVLSNVPFGDFGVQDKQFRGPLTFLTESIHNYFFAKALEHVRPGGYIVFVTSRYTMDGPEWTKVRRYLMSKAHFVGAVRLPNVAFNKSAKTQVIADLIVLQRFLPGDTVARNATAFIESPIHAALTKAAGRHADGSPKNIYRNAWYTAHPELVLGTEDTSGKLYGGGGYNVVTKDADVLTPLATALEQVLPTDGYQAATTEEPEQQMAEGAFKPGELRIAPKGDKDVRIQRVERDGTIVNATPRRVVDRDTNQTAVDEGAVARLTGMIQIRQALNDLIAVMRDPAAVDAAIRKGQAALRRAYDRFSGIKPDPAGGFVFTEYGSLNTAYNKALFANDPEATNLLELEVIKPKAVIVKDKKKGDILRISYAVSALADIFTKRTIQAARTIEHVDTPTDALLASLGVKTRIDWRYMAQISGQSVAALQDALRTEGRAYEQPGGVWVTADEYLSGDVVTKLEDAEEAAVEDPDRFRTNIAALQGVQPVAKTRDDIAAGIVAITLGSHWVPASDLTTFVEANLPRAGRNPFSATIDGAETYVRWSTYISDDAVAAGKRHALAVPYGPKSPTGKQPYTYGFTDLLKDALNLQLPDLGWWEGEGDTRQYIKDPDGTKAARANLEELRAQWMQWVFENPEVQDRLLEIFNTRYNRTVNRVFDGSHLVNVVDYDPVTKTGTRTAALPGLALPFPLFPHQLRAIWRALTTGNTLLAHEVGAGKTFEMIAIAMEMRRTGRARKPMVTVPTNLLAQWRSDILKAYPAAKVLAFDEKDLASDKRQKAMARIAFGDWDIVLVPHSSFELLKVSDQRMVDVMQRWVDELMDAEREAQKAGGGGRGSRGERDPSVKKLAAARKKIEDKIAAKLASINNSDDNALTWEQLGVDALLVDEAHSFKNLYFFSKIDQIRGLSRSEADKSLDMFVKVQDINEQSNYRNLVFATATPLMNSAAEVFTMQRYLQPQRLREQGLENFDNWYQVFASALPTTEQRPDGTYHEVMRLRAFRNLNLLYKTFADVMDYVGWEDMPYLKLPKLKGGRVRIVETDPHPLYETLRAWFTDRLEAIRQIPPHVDHDGNYVAPERMHPLTGQGMGRPDNILTIMGDARKAAIDMRLVLGADAKDFAGSRVQVAARDLVKIYREEQAKKGVQLVFLDMGTPQRTEPLEFLRNVTVEDTTEGAALGLEDEVIDDGVMGESAEGETDLYAALKQALIAHGVPSHEIAFIHQAKNAGERLALFQAANEGRIRFLFASTDKGGVGMNIQQRLVHVAHIDAPRMGRPGDIRQRDGRGIRQGNSYDEIHVSRYVTRGTTDEWLYGLLNTKSTTILQFMRGELSNYVDDDPSTMSIEEAQIRATGDKRGVELTELRTAQPRLQAQAIAAERTHAQARADLSSALSSRTSYGRDLADLRAWLPKFTSLRGDGFAITIGDTVYTKRAEADTALEAALATVSASSDGRRTLGTIGGLPLRASRRTYGKSDDTTLDDVYVGIDGSAFGGSDFMQAGRVEAPKGVAPKLTGVNLIASLVNMHETIPGKEAHIQGQIDRLTAEAADAQTVVDRPNPARQKAADALERIAAIEAELKAEGQAKDAATKAALTPTDAKDGEPPRRYTIRAWVAPPKPAKIPADQKTSAQNPDTFDIAMGDSKRRVAGKKVGKYFGVHKTGKGHAVSHLPTGMQLAVYPLRPTALAVAEYMTEIGGEGWNGTDAKKMMAALPERVVAEARRLTKPEEAAALAASRPKKKPAPAKGAPQADRKPAGPSGNASMGDFAEDVQSQTGHGTIPQAVSFFRAIEFPELVDLARALIGIPEVVKKFRKDGKRGEFRGAEGVKHGDIRIHAGLFRKGMEHQLAATLAHEIGHLIDWLPHYTLKHGNLLGRLQTLTNFLKHTYPGTDGVTVKLADVRDELLQVSALWRPWDPMESSASYTAYRKSSKELYADAISALLNNPGFLQEHAPIFYQEFFAQLDQKPDVKRAYFDLQALMSGTREELIARRREGVRGMFEEGDTDSVELERLRQAEKARGRQDFWFRFRQQFVDKNYPLIDRVNALITRGITINPDDNPVYFLEERNYLGGKIKAFLERHIQPVYAQLNAAEVDWHTFGEVLFYERIMAGDREEIANPRGITADAATELHAALHAALTPDQRRVVATSVKSFRAAIKGVAEDAYQAGLYTDDLHEQMQENPAYATFRVIEHLESGVTSRVYKQIGTLKDITNPADASIMKTLVTIKAIEHQKVKVATFDFLTTHFGKTDIKQAEEVWQGKGFRPIESRNREERLVTYFERGKLRGKYVDAYIADMLENQSVGQNNAVVTVMRQINSNWFRPVFTSVNLGFQFANVARDFWRFWKNQPTMTLGRAVQRYWEGSTVARLRAYGLPKVPTLAEEQRWADRGILGRALHPKPMAPSPAELTAWENLLQAEEHSVLSITFNDVSRGREVEDTQIEDILVHSGVGGFQARPRHPLLKPFLAVFQSIEQLGNFIETLPKAAGLHEYKGQGDIASIPPHTRSFVRRKLGSPDFLAGGTYKPISNEVFLFSNAITQAWRADYEVATGPTTRSGFWWKTAALNVVPKFLMAAASWGLYGALGGGDDDEDDPLKRLMRRVSEYDKTNYVIVPLGTSQGNTVYLRLPQDDTGRFIGGLVWKALHLADSRGDILKTMGQVVDYSSGQFPSVSPQADAISRAIQYASGRNPYDAYLGRNIFTDEEFKARDFDTFKKFVGWEFQALGGGMIWKFYPGEATPREQTTGQKIIQLPIVSNVVGRFVRISNFGETEDLRAAQAPVERDEARERKTERKALNEVIAEYQQRAPGRQTRPEQQQLAKDLARRLYPADTPKEREDHEDKLFKKLSLGIIRGEDDPVSSAVLAARSNDQRVAIIRRARSTMTAADYRRWIETAVREKVISPTVYKDVQAPGR
jgi:N12 class adenine-specific DNA methylase/2'-5' RNA ligase